MASRVTKWDMETDVVVMGSGGAGLTAAIMAADQGARVVVIERSNKVGGTTAVSGGILCIVGVAAVAVAIPALSLYDSRKDGAVPRRDPGADT